MKRVILHGCSGKMGIAVYQEMKQAGDMELVAGVDRIAPESADFPVFQSLEECGIEADVVIDFSNSSVTDSLVTTCVKKKLPLVLCTTGLDEAQVNLVKEAALRIPILKSANMSLGVNTVQRLISVAAKLLYSEGFDIEIIEKHHRMKQDAPSGTALMLANSVRSCLTDSVDYIYDRSQVRKAREKNEIGISVIRGGGVVGEHEVIFAADNELVSIKHEAFSRAVFAKGAVVAAGFLAECKPGLYTMQDVLFKE